MLEVDELDDVGRALERVRKHKAPLSATLGRHMNDEMVSFYVKSPGGFDVEFGTEGLRSTTPAGSPASRTAVSYWGHDFGGGPVTSADGMTTVATRAPEIPEGMSPTPGRPGRSHELIDSLLGDSSSTSSSAPARTSPSTPTTPRPSQRPASSATCSAGSPPASPW